MKIQRYKDADWKEVAALFNRVFANRSRLLSSATSMGYVRDKLNQRIADAAASEAWIVKKNGSIVGFISSHIKDSENGFITTPVIEDINSDAANLLLATAEDFLRDRGVKNARVVGVWREYNVGFGDFVHMWLLNHGYESYKIRDLSAVMELNLTQFKTTPLVESFRKKNEADGYVFEFLQHRHIESLKKLAFADWMLEGLRAPFAENPRRYPYAVCRKVDTVVGFCGGCLVEKYGWANWAYILVEERYRHRGIGAVLLSMANEWLKSQGGKFQIIFTGVGNQPAQRLYRKAGYKYLFVSAQHNIQKKQTDQVN